MLALAGGLMVLAGAVLSVPGRPAPRMTRAAPRSRPRLGWRRGSRKPVRAASEVARVLVEVAARLRAGSPMAVAWRRSLPAPPPRWAEPVLAETGLPMASARAPTGSRKRSRARAWFDRYRGRSEPAAADVAAAVAACRLAARTGAPLAEVIDVVVGGIAEAAEADNLRRTALAGPRATARLLAWLPAGGVALGTVLGADPVGVLLGGGLGGLCLLGGVALFVAGNRWVAALVADAERAGR